MYEGQLQGLKRHGEGTWRNKGGEVFSGAWKDDHWNGHGTLSTPPNLHSGPSPSLHLCPTLTLTATRHLHHAVLQLHGRIRALEASR
jgi:hypothetical protein